MPVPPLCFILGIKRGDGHRVFSTAFGTGQELEVAIIFISDSGQPLSPSFLITHTIFFFTQIFMLFAGDSEIEHLQ